MQNERRQDLVLARAIDQAIELDRTRGAIAAWTYLVDHGVSPNCIRRVLAMADGGRIERRAVAGAAEGEKPTSPTAPEPALPPS